MIKTNIDIKSCEWLLDSADAPIRHRVYRELLNDERTAKKIEPELLDNPTVRLWLKHLKPQTPPQHRRMTHGSFDFCLENAMLKCVQLGLHAGIPQFMDAIHFYIENFHTPPPLDISCKKDSEIADVPMIAAYLTLAEIDDHKLQSYMLNRLDAVYDFVRKGDYGIYMDGAEKAELKGLPSVYHDRPVIKKHIGGDDSVLPGIHDIVAMHRLYDLRDPAVNEKINAIIRYISTDEFHSTVAEGYGIGIYDNKTRYYTMGWDPKYPGWFDTAAYFEAGFMPRLLFFLEYISLYPAARDTIWFHDVCHRLNQWGTDRDTHSFPKEWLKESQGYAVMGHHISFGENRRKRNWAEIESTFYMQLLQAATEE